MSEYTIEGPDGQRLTAENLVYKQLGQAMHQVRTESGELLELIMTVRQILRATIDGVPTYEVNYDVNLPVTEPDQSDSGRRGVNPDQRLLSSGVS